VPKLPADSAARSRPRSGRPRTTSREEIASVGLGLFARRGFEQTTLDDVAAAVGVSRRTILRYYESKNDIVWGTFGEHLAGLRAGLAAADPSEPMLDTLPGRSSSSTITGPSSSSTSACG
jgi:AcrR family transcriptional regulator